MGPPPKGGPPPNGVPPPNGMGPPPNGGMAGGPGGMGRLDTQAGTAISGGSIYNGLDA